MDRACTDATRRILHSKNICCSKYAANHSLWCESVDKQNDIFWAYVDVMHGTKRRWRASESETEKGDEWKRHWERWIEPKKNECHSRTRCHIYLPALRSTCCCCRRRLCVCQNIWLRWMHKHCTLYYSYQIFVPVEVIHTYIALSFFFSLSLLHFFSHSLPLAHYFRGNAIRKQNIQ